MKKYQLNLITKTIINISSFIISSPIMIGLMYGYIKVINNFNLTFNQVIMSLIIFAFISTPIVGIVFFVLKELMTNIATNLKYNPYFNKKKG